LLSIYDVAQAKVLAQVEVGRKENKITKAASCLKLVEITEKVVTGDAIHTQHCTLTSPLFSKSVAIFSDIL
jgi:hypothetical protein